MTRPDSPGAANPQEDSRVRRFSEMMRERRINKKFSMYARADTIVKHPEPIESLRDAGLEYLTVGIESFKDAELDKFNKKTSVQMNNEAIKILQRFGIGISAHFIVNPDYTPEDFKQLFRYVCDRELFRPAYAILTPLPGTELFLKNHDRLVIKDHDFYDFAHSIFPTKLSRKEFYREYANLYKKTYSFQRYFKSKLKDLFSSFVKANCSMKRNVDRMSLSRMVLVHIFAYPHYLRAKISYQSEPLISSFNP